MVSLKRLWAITLAATFFCGAEMVFAIPASNSVEGYSLTNSPRNTRQTPDITKLCTDIDWSQQPSGVQSVRNRQVSEGTNTERCLILNPGELDDIAPTVNAIPSDTTVYFSAHTSDGSTPTVVDYPVKSPLNLGYRQHLHAAPDSESQKIRLVETDFTGAHIVHLGDPLNFQPDQQGLSVISGLHFVSSAGGSRRHVDSIIFVECNSQDLRVENNVFHISSRASVFMDCKLPNSSENFTTFFGPGLHFLNNHITGREYSFYGVNYIPDEGVFINLPLVVSVKNRIEVSGNTFTGSMSEAIEIILGEHSNASVTNNTINITTTGNIRADTERTYRGGIVLEGRSFVIAEHLPEFVLAGNRIDVTDTAITLLKSLVLDFSCNNLEAGSPWNQVIQNEVFHAISPRAQSQLCSSANTTDGTINNQWASKTTPRLSCDGLQQYSGSIPFIDINCEGPVEAPATTTALEANNSIMIQAVFFSIMLLSTVASLLANTGMLF